MSRVFLLGWRLPPGDAVAGRESTRTWQLVELLLAAGCSVRLAALAAIPTENDAPPACSHPRERLEVVQIPGSTSVAELLPLVQTSAADVMVAVGSPAAFLLANLPLPIPFLADLDVTALAEVLVAGENEPPFERTRAALEPILRRADRLSVATDRELDILVGQLGIIGRLNQHTAGEELVAVVPLDEHRSAAAPASGAGCVADDTLLAWLQAPRRCGDHDRAALWPRRDEAAQLADEALELRRQLVAIESSGGYRLWMAGLALRRGSRSALSRLAAWGVRLITAVGGVLAMLAVPLVAAVRAVASGLAWLYLFGWTLPRLARAGWRTAVAGDDRPPVPVPASPPAPAVRPRVLVVAPFALVPAYQGGSARIVRLLEQLASSCDLYVFTFGYGSEDAAQERELARFCRRVVVQRRQDPEPESAWELDPPSVRRLYSQQARQRLADLVRAEQIDVVQLELAELGQYADVLGEAKVVSSQLDLGFVSSFRRRSAGFHRRFDVDRELWSSLGDWMRLLRYELRCCERVDQVQVMSERDGALLARFLSDGWRRIRVVPNGVEIPAELPPDLAERNRSVLFVGFFGHSPNVDAVTFLVEEVWPLVRARHPDATLTVVGATPPASVTAFHGRDGISVVGTVPTPRPYYRSHRLLAAPLRAGSGTRLKILEAFADGLPVVTTAIGAEGLEARDGEHLLLGESPLAQATAICRLLDDAALHRRLSAAARELVAERYGWDRVAARCRAGYDELLAERPVPVSGAGTVEAEAAAGSAPLAPPAAAPDVSIVIPTLGGGARLEQCLGAIAAQRSERAKEVICVDSGSGEADLAMMRRFGVRLVRIPKASFNHGLTRDLGARHARGRVLVFLNQDAVPCDRDWLDALVDPLLRPGPYAAIQGGIREFPEPGARFFWDSCGARFYFTRETARWMEEYRGMGFSTINAALRREAWEQIPFGWAPIMEDKKWQRDARRAGLEIGYSPYGAVFHSHTYGGRALLRRCAAEGFGWRTLGIRYDLGDCVSDLRVGSVLAEAARGLWRREIHSRAELLFPFLRPLGLYWGNRWARDYPA